MKKPKLDTKKGILLDFGCGARKQGVHWMGMDKRGVEGVDIVHDLEKLPYPLPDESVLTCLASHVLEHLDPRLTIDIFNEIWRMMKKGGELVIAVPYGGSRAFWQDPTHINGFTEVTFEYFDPKLNPTLYGIYSPKPWRITRRFWHPEGMLEVVMVKRGEGWRDEE